MLNLLLLIIIGIGITNLAVNAVVFDNPRDFIISKVSGTKYFSWVEELITCMMCSGFWVGFLMSFDGTFEIFNPIYSGAIVSVSSYMFGSIMDYIDILVAGSSFEIDNEDTEEVML